MRSFHVRKQRCSFSFLSAAHAHYCCDKCEAPFTRFLPHKQSHSKNADLLFSSLSTAKCFSWAEGGRTTSRRMYLQLTDLWPLRISLTLCGEAQFRKKKKKKRVVMDCFSQGYSIIYLQLQAINNNSRVSKVWKPPPPLPSDIQRALYSL